MGAGIARSLVRKWPSVLEADKQTAKDIDKLGEFSYAEVEPGKMVFNLYTQPWPGPYFSLDAFQDCLKEVFYFLDRIDPYAKLKIGMPLIGAGLGGGNWAEIEEILTMETPSWRTIHVYHL